MASELRALVQPERRDLRKAFSPEKLSYSIAKGKKKVGQLKEREIF